MDEVAVARRASLDAVAAVEPVRLRERLHAQLEGSSMVPGVLTILSGRVRTDGSSLEDETVWTDIADRAAGVQLIYEGLRLTRTLAHAEPWTEGDSEEGNLAILAADVLVARGFSLLARTDAAERAVETVRAFGRDQTERRETADPTIDRNLEADVLELAVIAGTSLEAGGSPSAREFAADVFGLGVRDGDGGFPSAAAFFSDATEEQLETLAAVGEGFTGAVDD